MAKSVSGIEVRVLNVFKGAPMKVIRAGLRDRGDIGDAAKLSGVEGLAELDFLDSVERRKEFRQSS